MIDSGMWSNENFAALPSMARLLLIGIITLADDQGRCKANPAYLRSQIFPYEDIATGTIDCWLEQMQANETVILYTTGGKAYLQLANWWEYQPLDWARPSDYPAPDGWRDRIRFNAKGNVCLTYNWRTKSGTCPIDNCDSRGVPTQVPTIVPAQASTQVNKTKVNKTKVTEDDRHDGDNDWRSVVDTYQREIGIITPTVGEDMQTYFAELGATLLIDAIKEAARNNIRKWSYVAGILKSWRTNGRQPLGTRANGDKIFEPNAWQILLNQETPDYTEDES